jgi:TolA-binding protein
MKALLLVLLSLTLIGCKTREDIAREQMVDNMALQVRDGQKLNADFSIKLQALEDRIGQITGQVEEGDHQTTTNLNDKFNSLSMRLKQLEASNQRHEASLETLKESLNNQQIYIQEVLKTLENLSKKKTAKKKQGPYGQAMSLYGKGKYKEAYARLKKLLGSNKYKGARKARILHNLGMISYIKKQNNDALTYFSRLFTEFPKSGYNKNGLLHLARTFNRLKKKEEAKQTLEELISRFSKSKQASQAKKLLAKL